MEVKLLICSEKVCYNDYKLIFIISPTISITKYITAWMVLVVSINTDKFERRFHSLLANVYSLTENTTITYLVFMMLHLLFPYKKLQLSTDVEYLSTQP